MSEIMFSHQKRVKKAFFSIWPPPRGSCFAKIRVSCQTFKMDIEMFFLTPHFWPFKNHWTCQKSCFLIRRGLKKPFFLSDLPQGVLFCQIRVSCQTFKMVIQRCFLLTPIFNHLKPLDMSEIMFSYQKCVKKAFFSIWPPPGGLVLPK